MKFYKAAVQNPTHTIMLGERSFGRCNFNQALGRRLIHFMPVAYSQF